MLNANVAGEVAFELSDSTRRWTKNRANHGSIVIDRCFDLVSWQAAFEHLSESSVGSDERLRFASLVACGIANSLDAHADQLAQFKEQQVMDVAASARRLSPAQRLSWGAQRNSGNSDLGGLPDEFFCSITLDVMQDPVLAADGFSYERGAIEDWFAKGHRTSPKTGAQIAHTELQPNLAIRNLIQHAIGKKKSDPPLEDDID